LNFEGLDNAQKVKLKMAAFFKSNYSPDRKPERILGNIITSKDKDGQNYQV